MKNAELIANSLWPKADAMHTAMATSYGLLAISQRKEAIKA